MDANQTKPGTDMVGHLRRWILGVMVLGLLGTVTELVLLEHYEEPLQWVPVGLIGLALVTIAWHVTGNSATSRRVFHVLMWLFVLAGFAGFAAHFHGSAEFQLESDPGMDIYTLIEKVMRAKAPPLLAPGMMLQMGLLGLAYLFSDTRYRRSGTT
jgi:hypothetical protein